MKVSVTIQLYKSKKLSNGTHPIVLTLYKNRQRRKFSLGVSCHLHEWNEAYRMVKPEYADFETINKRINQIKQKAHDVLDHFKFLNHDFSIKDFEDHFKGISSRDVFGFFSQRVEELFSTGKDGNALVYQDTLSVMKAYHGKKQLPFSEVNYNFLESFETFQRMRGNKDSTISVRMRTIRALFNRAIKKKFCPPEIYPFNDYEISKLRIEANRRSISKESILKIIAYSPPEESSLVLSRHLFLFSYFTMGMNFTDMVQLKWSNINEGRVNYRRQKTGRYFSIKILEPVQEILDCYKTSDELVEYVFPILSIFYKNSYDIKIRTKNALRDFNKDLRVIGKELNLERDITSYVARHSWAMAMKQSNVSTALISEGLGHSTEKTTQLYLDSFGSGRLDEANAKIIL